MVEESQISVYCISSGGTNQPLLKELILVFSPPYNTIGHVCGMVNRNTVLAKQNWRNRCYQTKRNYNVKLCILIIAHLHSQDLSNFRMEASQRVTIVPVERDFLPI